MRKTLPDHPGTDHPNTDRPDTTGSGSDRSASDRSGSDRPASDRPGANSLRAPSIWPTFAFMAGIWMAVALYTNERVLTPQVLANLAGRGNGILMSSAQTDNLRLLERLSYGFIPVVLALRIAVTALLLQMFTMLLVAEIHYRDLFRASLWGFSAVIYGMFLQTLALDLLGPGLTVPQLSVVPDSLAALLLNPGPSLSIGYTALSLLNLHGLLWIAIVFTHLRFRAGASPRHALLIPLAGWTTISLAKLGLTVFMAQILL